MARLRLYSLLNKWSRIRFTRIKAVRVSVPLHNQPVVELYLCDAREPAAWLFVCRLTHVRDEQATIARYTRWLEAYYQPVESGEFSQDLTLPAKQAEESRMWLEDTAPQAEDAVMPTWRSEAQNRTSYRGTF